jgi:hypothetical protein
MSSVISLSGPIVVDTSSSTTISVNNDQVLQRTNYLSSLVSNQDFAIYLEYSKWSFFNPAMDWKYNLTNLNDPFPPPCWSPNPCQLPPCQSTEPIQYLTPLCFLVFRWLGQTTLCLAYLVPGNYKTSTPLE